MKILMLGAGAIGGYLGARIHLAGGDMSFLVRPARARQLLASGLQVVSPFGDMTIAPKLMTSAEAAGQFDVAILSCKAYDLDTAIEAVAPALAPHGCVLPLLNGMAHLDRLDARFGQSAVLGGFALIGVTVGAAGEIRHLNELQRFVIGARQSQVSPWLAPLAEVMAGSGIDFSLSDRIEDEMWEKFVFLATLAGATCTLRAAVGDILETRAGEGFMLGLLDECALIASRHGHAPSPERLAFYRAQLTARGSPNMASMLRDLEKGGPTEGEHILGDMARRASAMGVATPLLDIAHCHLQAYECRRRREQVATAAR